MKYIIAIVDAYLRITRKAKQSRKRSQTTLGYGVRILHLTDRLIRTETIVLRWLRQCFPPYNTQAELMTNVDNVFYEENPSSSRMLEITTCRTSIPH